MEILFIVGAFVVGVIFHASASALWNKWFPKVAAEVKSTVDPVAPVAVAPVVVPVVVADASVTPPPVPPAS